MFSPSKINYTITKLHKLLFAFAKLITFLNYIICNWNVKEADSVHCTY